MALDMLDLLAKSGSSLSTSCSGNAHGGEVFVVTVHRRLMHLVEDDEQLRRLLSRLLRSSKLAVGEHESGDMFLARLEELDPGCVLPDSNMPGADGFAVQGALRDRGMVWPLVMMTGAGDATVVALMAGALDLMNKPFGRPEWLSSIDQAFHLFAETSARPAGAAP